MGDAAAAPGTGLLALWERLRPLPGGKAVFSFFIGTRIPYTGSIGARVEELQAGHARVRLRDRRRVRNHLGSIHAVALTNLGELAGGLATLTGIPPGVRGIVLRLESQYLKKARGTLIAEARWKRGPSVDLDTMAQSDDAPECWVQANIQDRDGDDVARVRALWRLGRGS